GPARATGGGTTTGPGSGGPVGCSPRQRRRCGRLDPRPPCSQRWGGPRVVRAGGARPVFAAPK
ncbi:hypothetical protein R0J90_19350, partial [Micrococcus sp. SIMBA_144]